jgi:hypothetical protein
LGERFEKCKALFEQSQIALAFRFHDVRPVRRADANRRFPGREEEAQERA